MSKIKFNKVLNKKQYQAVTSTEGPYLVISSAGSGKTRILIYRVAYLIHNKKVDPSSILLLTFTRKAAMEMINRATALLDHRCRDVAGGTFHSFAFFTLKKYHKAIGYPRNFNIIDQSDSQDLIKLVTDSLGYFNDRYFPRKGTLSKIISKAINTSDTIRNVVEDEYPRMKRYIAKIDNLRKEYNKYKKIKALMDYDDLLVKLKLLLKKNPKISKTLSLKYKYIMVDEFQDTNNLQSIIIKYLSSEHNNIMVVGDFFQSIYAFRGANYKNIINFPKRFKHCKIITVERNYRSTQKILALGNEVVKYATEKYDKKMYSDINKGNKPIFYRTDNEVKQATFIVNKIKESKLPLEDIAVLFRSGHHSNILEVELKKNKIPFIKYGGMQFTELAHVKDLLSLLKVIYHPKDPISWSRVLRMIPGIGPKTTMNIIDAITERKYNYKALKNFQEANYWKDLQVLYKLIKSLKKEAKSVEAIVVDIIKYYKPYFENNYDRIKKREEDINSLLEISQEYSSALAMLNDLTLEPAFKKSPKNIEGKLTLSTIHSIKGLEMDTVFIINLVEGDLPSKYALDDPEQIEEERRLFYVAVTRAKNNLYLISPMSDADFERRVIKPNLRVEKDKTSNVSRFIKEIKNFDKIVDIHNFNPVHP